MKMFVAERRNMIMKLLKEKRRVTVKELAEKINVSEATLRSDLNQMEEEGLLTRTHGGAVLNDAEEMERKFSVRQLKNKGEKQKIARKALDLIEERQCILLDASSTVFELATYIRKQCKHITVITNGIETALELKENPDITVILIGGVVSKGSVAIQGTLGINILDSVNIDTFITSADGFTFETGLTDFNLYEVALKKEMMKRADNVIALVDSTKFEKKSSAVFAKTEEIDVLITDKKLDDESMNQFIGNGVKVIVTD